MKPFTLWVSGLPAPMPRPQTYISKTGRPVTYNPTSANAWKKAITIRWKADPNHPRTPATEPLEVCLTFKLPRPKSHYRKNGALRESAPDMVMHAIRPDVDNLTKTVLDALTRVGAWVDDAQVCRLVADKHYAERTDEVGMLLSIAER